MVRKTIIISAEVTAVGGAREVLELRIPMGFINVIWMSLIAQNLTTAMTLIEMSIRAGTHESLLGAANPGAAGVSVAVVPFVPGQSGISFIARFTTAVAGDRLGLWAYGMEDVPSGLI